jgi:hypothetical protein
VKQVGNGTTGRVALSETGMQLAAAQTLVTGMTDIQSEQDDT